MSFRNEFEKARDFLILHRSDYAYAYEHFQWPRPEEFNWALDFFDPMAEGNEKTALWLVKPNGEQEKYSFSDLSERSNRVANYFLKHGVQKGDSVFLLIEDELALWEVMLAAMKVGAVIVPANPLLSQQELKDRLDREKVKVIATSKKHAEKFSVAGSNIVPLVVGADVPDWISYEEVYKESAELEARVKTSSSDPLFRYFTSSGSNKPRIVEHTYGGFPIGHLPTMFWMGLRPGDIHLGINSPGWAMHDWNNFISPWSAESTILILQHERFNAKLVLDALSEYGVTTFCAPPTVWRLLIHEDLSAYKNNLREAISTGENLSAEIISKVHKEWGVFVRDGYSLTEVTTLIGIPPGESSSFGTLGKVLPGFKVELLGPEGQHSDEGEIAVNLDNNPWGMAAGHDLSSGYFRTGDVAYRDEEGNFTYEKRIDGIFKSSDYRISPTEIEFVLKDFPSVREAVVIPSPDPIRDVVPKAIVSLVKGTEPTKELALDIMNFARTKLSPFKRIRRVEFMDIPKNTAGEVQREELIAFERKRRQENDKGPYEFWEEDAKIILPDTWAQELP